MEMVGDSGAKGTSFEISVEPDKLKAVKIYVATGDHQITENERSRFHFKVEELNPTGVPEAVSYDAIFHANGSKD